MDIWFWLACGAIAMAVLGSVWSTVSRGDWREVLGDFATENLGIALGAALVGLALVVIVLTGVNDGAALLVGLVVGIGLIAVIAWRIRH